ncbi:hypothetical protein NW752_004918 [Fusarium irregulare]|uniref:Cystinosin n=1 Tax=Fusarium irregulare TaxID=2494466 RepID=A0A9W8PKI4_9HYPO|nr:hypothetical protein NW766_008114 [Fusarium irregulare]KAJ4019817.1 hypothetical protein NW752_004918 [Fusarium irregulare]
MAVSFLNFLSGLFGWVYFFAWSASFYPQPLLNWRRRSTTGTTVDFPLINVLGFAAYFSSNVAFYYSPEIRAQYAARHKGLESTVQFNDITFALHALVLSIITTSQYLSPALWGFAPNHGNRPSRFILGVAAGCIAGVLCTWIIVSASPGNDAVYDWVALDIVYAVGYVKLIITLIKYTPQIIANYKNQSTEGWSIWQILFDLTGGVLSVSQQAIDSYQLRDWSGITGNPVKFALGNISMIYDSIFMAQHYVWYRDAENTQSNDRESESLLQDEERRA